MQISRIHIQNQVHHYIINSMHYIINSIHIIAWRPRSQHQLRWTNTVVYVVKPFKQAFLLDSWMLQRHNGSTSRKRIKIRLILSNVAKYLVKTRKAPLSLKCDYSKQLEENEYNGPWFLGEVHGQRPCRGLCFQQIPKTENRLCHVGICNLPRRLCTRVG